MAKRATKSASTQAGKQLDVAGMSYLTLSYEHDPNAASYGAEAAEKLGLEPGSIAKTLLVEVAGGETQRGARAKPELVVAVVPVEQQLSLRSLAASVGAKKAKMADPDEAERRTGYVRGGISPFGQRLRHRTIIDVSLSELDRVYVSGGQRGMEIGVSPSAFVELLEAQFADIVAK